MFSYHAARFVTPLLFIYLLFEFKSKIKWQKSTTVIAGIIGLIFIVLTIYTYILGAGNRVTTSGIFALANQAGEIRANLVVSGAPEFVSRIFYNKPLSFIALLIRNYAQYFSPQFLFTNGPGEWTYGMMTGQGVMYLFELILLIGFIVAIIQNKLGKLRWLLVWLLLAPIPASLTIGPGFAANRAAIMMPAITIASAIGALTLYATLKGHFKRFAIICFGLVSLLSLVSFLFSYFNFQKVFGAPGMIYGAQEIFEYVEKNESKYDDIIVSKKLSEPHIYAAFYEKMDPVIVQNQSQYWDFDKRGLAWVDQLSLYTLGKYEFTNIDWQQIRSRENSLVVIVPEEMPWNLTPVYTVYYPDKKAAYYIVDINSLE